MARVYSDLHRSGHAFSIEVWDEEGELVGGGFGVQVGGVFAGDSMFHAADHASKVGFVDLARRMYVCGATVMDCQFPTPHLLSLGAEEISGRQFRAMLDSVRDDPVSLPGEREPVSAILDFKERLKAS